MTFQYILYIYIRKNDEELLNISRTIGACQITDFSACHLCIKLKNGCELTGNKTEAFLATNGIDHRV